VEAEPKSDQNPPIETADQTNVGDLSGKPIEENDIQESIPAQVQEPLPQPPAPELPSLPAPVEVPVVVPQEIIPVEPVLPTSNLSLQNNTLMNSISVDYK